MTKNVIEYSCKSFIKIYPFYLRTSASLPFPDFTKLLLLTSNFCVVGTEATPFFSSCLVCLVIWNALWRRSTKDENLRHFVQGMIQILQSSCLPSNYLLCPARLFRQEKETEGSGWEAEQAAPSFLCCWTSARRVRDLNTVPETSLEGHASLLLGFTSPFGFHHTEGASAVKRFLYCVRKGRWLLYGNEDSHAINPLSLEEEHSSFSTCGGPDVIVSVLVNHFINRE